MRGGRAHAVSVRRPRGASQAPRAVRARRGRRGETVLRTVETRGKEVAVTQVQVELVLNSRAMIGEGPVWDHQRLHLLWVDIAGNALHEFDPASGVDTVTDVGQPISAVGLRADGGLVAALRDGFGILRSDRGRIDELIDVEKDRPANRMNDGKCDCRGRFWAGTQAVDHTRGAGSLYCLERSDGRLRVSRKLPGLTIANGLDWSSDNTRMYYIDSVTQRIDMFDFDADRGALRNRRTFVAIPPAEGLPDGMTVDSEGYLWVALFGAGRVRRYDPDGRIDMEIRFPVSLVTSCAFGGAALDKLYVTTARHRLTADEAAAQPTAGGLFVCQPGPRGRPSYAFG